MQPPIEGEKPARPAYWTGFGLACLLSGALLGLTSLQTLTTFVIRLYESEVMLGAIGNVGFFSRVTADVALFVVSVVALHVLLALAVHSIGYLTCIACPPLNQSRHGVVVAWFAFVVAAILLLNADWYPRSNSGSYYAALASQPIGSFTLAELVTLSLCVVAAAVVLVALRTLAHEWWASAAISRRPVAFIVVGAAVVLVLSTGFRGLQSDVVADSRPNVVILGLDSLRLSELRRFGGDGATPRIDAFLQRSAVFPDATTPLARTFPSWVSILTGKAPRSTGAIFNLVRRQDVDADPTIATMLSEAGYSSVFATDEVRFSNIDESYGFDRVIAPPIGAADFLISQVSDLPLTNVLANTTVGDVLLKFLYSNRAVAYLYKPDSFVTRLRDELPADRPLMLAVHLTIAHWPYFHSELTPAGNDDTSSSTQVAYADAVRTLDTMFGEVVDLLRDEGILDNAIVVVLSDHGEALGLPIDSLLQGENAQVEGLQVPVPVLASGHGQSVLSPVQFQVLLGFRGFGAQSAIGREGLDLPYPASLEDVVPTLLDLLNRPADGTDGESLVSFLEAEAYGAIPARRRVRFTETDIRVLPSEEGEFEQDDAAKQVARLFEADNASGWLHLRPGVINSLMMLKERAAIEGDWLLAALPVAPTGHQYLLLHRRSGSGRVLTSVPEPTDVVARRLWDALHENFAGELKPPLVVTPESLAVFERQWSAVEGASQGAAP
jgi:hypothetical protein